MGDGGGGGRPTWLRGNTSLYLQVCLLCPHDKQPIMQKLKALDDQDFKIYNPVFFNHSAEAH